jgi:hypothetical protein
MIICDDNIYIVPDSDKFKEPLLQYCLERNVFLWQQDNKIRQDNAKRNAKREIAVKILRKVGIYKFARTIYRSLINKK